MSSIVHSIFREKGLLPDNHRGGYIAYDLSPPMPRLIARKLSNGTATGDHNYLIWVNSNISGRLSHASWWQRRADGGLNYNFNCFMCVPMKYMSFHNPHVMSEYDAIYVNIIQYQGGVSLRRTGQCSGGHVVTYMWPTFCVKTKHKRSVTCDQPFVSKQNTKGWSHVCD